MVKLDYIITGTGRCGTLFAANYLTSSGIPCTHEAVFTPFGLDYALEVLAGKRKPVSSKVSIGDNLSDDYEMYLNAESSYMSAPFLGEFSRSQVIHMVRNPIKVVASFVFDRGYFNANGPSPNPEIFPYEDFVYTHLPSLREDVPPIDRACLFWVGWNEMIEASGAVDYRHRLEDPVEELANFLGSSGTYSKVSNAAKEPPPKWSPAQIQTPSIRKRFKDLARKYGYFSILY